jgi:hypothetical protein
MKLDKNAVQNPQLPTHPDNIVIQKMTTWRIVQTWMVADFSKLHTLVLKRGKGSGLPFAVPCYSLSFIFWVQPNCSSNFYPVIYCCLECRHLALEDN